MASVRKQPGFEPSYMDYRKLAAGIDHYEKRGYQYMEVPWVVRPAAVNITLPPNHEATKTQYGDLVGSGEQSFIELMIRGRAIVKACCITPCFRLEEGYDELHHGYFMKLELINTQANQQNLRDMIGDATGFFEHYVDTSVVQTGPDAYDIVDSKDYVELGSYGFRTFRNTEFIYGTGAALPRLDTVMRRRNNEL